MSDGRRRLNFTSEDEVIAEIDRLQAHGYTKRKNWSLPMVCFHLTRGALKPPASPTPTPEQAAAKKGFVDLILQTGKGPPGFESPPHMTPKPDCGDEDVERFKRSLRELKNYPHPLVDFGPFGPVPTEEIRKLTLGHASHHLSFLEPKKPARREGLTYANEDEVIAEVMRLRRGYAQAGGWSLPKMCAHLEKSVRFRMQPGPFPPNTPEQEARGAMFEQIMVSGRLPDSIEAPPAMMPPDECGDEAVDAFLAAMEEFKRFPGPIAPHRLFGRLSDADARRLNLIHCAHHLSYLTPTTS